VKPLTAVTTVIRTMLAKSAPTTTCASRRLRKNSGTTRFATTNSINHSCQGHGMPITPLLNFMNARMFSLLVRPARRFLSRFNKLGSISSSQWTFSYIEIDSVTCSYVFWVGQAHQLLVSYPDRSPPAVFQTVTTILPFCSLDSMYRWASAIASSGKVRSMIGFRAPDWRPS